MKITAQAELERRSRAYDAVMAYDELTERIKKDAGGNAMTDAKERA